MRHIIPLALVGLFAPLAAHADSEVYIDVARDGQLDATLIGVPRVAASALTLRDDTDPSAAPIHPTMVRGFADGNEPVALAIVYNGQEVWLGNDQIEPEDSVARYYGALGGMKAMLAQLQTMRLPHNSVGTLISYAEKATIRVPMGPIANVSADALGTQRDYYSQIGTYLVGGIELGMHELEQTAAPVKVLIVVGDGNDTDNESAKRSLLDLKKRAAREHIRTFAITYKGMLSDPGNVITTMIPAAHTVASFEGIAASAASFIAQVSDRTYATFPASELKLDGREHALVIRAGRDDLDTVYVTFPNVPKATPWYRTGWWMQLFAGLGAIALIALGMRLTSRRSML